jgi:uncharacterized membrane protein
MTRQTFFPLFQWLQETLAGQTIRNYSALVALAQIIHLLGVTLLVGTLLMVDLTLLGFGMRRHPVSRIARELAPWTTAGLIVMLVSGPLMLTSEALKCYDASFFWIKMGLLAVTLLFHFTVHQRIAMSEPPVSRWRAGAVACVSLALWVSVALAGKMIGIYGDDLRQLSDQ